VSNRPRPISIQYDHQVFSTHLFGGIPRYFVEVASRISRYPDVNASVFAPFYINRFLAARRNQISIIGFYQPHPIPHTARTIRSLNAVLFRGYSVFSRPDIVHETFYWPRRAASGASKIVLTVHDTIVERLPQYFQSVGEQRELKARALRRADHIICISQNTRRDLIEFYEVDPDKISVVYLGSSLDKCELAPIDPGDPFILYVGIRRTYKNFLRFLEAFGTARLYETHKLVCFGGGKLNPEELSSMQRHGIPRECVLQTEGDDAALARHYKAADAFVYPSLYEGFGIPLLEAMECHCPVICSNSSAFPEVVGDAAVYFDPRSVASVSRALVEVTQSPEKRAQMISKGKARLSLFSWDRCAAETYAVYQALL
jgi:glycosyltransferase involved in cell wall biosynthesis